MGGKTPLMAAAEQRAGGDLKPWISARAAEGWSLRRMARHLEVSPQLLWLWTRKWQGRARTCIDFPPEADAVSQPQKEETSLDARLLSHDPRADTDSQHIAQKSQLVK